jgi:hypothetical protein
MSERLTDEKAFLLFPGVLELAELLSPPIAERMRFGLDHGVMIRQVTLVPQGSAVDLVKLARLVRKFAGGVPCASNTASKAGRESSPRRHRPAT